MNNCTSALGFAVFIFLAWLLSANRRAVCWRPVLGGMLLQFIFALLIFCFPATRSFFVMFSNGFTSMINLSQEGIVFVFGSLGVTGPPHGFILAFQVLPFIVIFSSMMSALYFVRIMPLVIRFFAIIFARTMRVSGAESLCASANIFVGIESSVTVRPYLSRMTESELFVVLTTGMATSASSVLAVYVSMLKDTFPLIAGHLLSASLISAPAAFVICKLMIPEIGSPETMRAEDCRVDSGDDSKNFVEAVMKGADYGGRMAASVAITLIAFVGLLAIINGLIGWIGVKVGFGGLNIQAALAYMFCPFTWLMGVPSSEVWPVARMLGERLVVTEIPAYQHLADFAAGGGSGRSVLIASYALCGFAHVASMGIFVAGTGALAPDRLPTLSRLGPRALLAATLVTMMTGCVAGMFYYGQAGILR